MHLKQLIPLVVFITGTPCFSQDAPIADITDVTKITILSPGFGYEKRIAKYQSLYIQGFFSISGGIGYSSSEGFLSEFHLDPTLSLEYRYYYNFLSRQERGKRVEMNSLNYISPFFRTAFVKRDIINSSGYVESERKPIYGTGVTWGMQRNFKSRFSLDINIGFGYSFEGDYTDEAGETVINNSQFYFPGRISFGFWLNKRK